MGEAFEGAVSFALSALRKSDLVLTAHQKEAFQSVISRKDTFISLPTGYGKSIIFECLPHCCMRPLGGMLCTNVCVGSVPFGCTDEEPSH